MAILSPRLRRLDNALADLARECDVMLLSELDGFVAGIAVCPEAIAPAEWLPIVWDAEGEAPPFADDDEAAWFARQVCEYRDAVAAMLAKGRYAPFLEIDPRHDEVLWELWIEGFDAAMRLRPDAWAAIAGDGASPAAEALAGLATLAQIAADESDLDRATIDRLTDEAPRLIPGWIARLHAWRVARAAPPAVARPVKAGRNDPCPCGSGIKHKRCCGVN